jgi:hypothetical protein
LLPAAAIHACKAETYGVARQRRVALETAPLRRPARKIPDTPLIATDLYFGRSVHDHFYGALAAITAASNHRGSPLELLRTRR